MKVYFLDCEAACKAAHLAANRDNRIYSVNLSGSRLVVAPNAALSSWCSAVVFPSSWGGIDPNRPFYVNTTYQSASTACSFTDAVLEMQKELRRDGITLSAGAGAGNAA